MVNDRWKIMNSVSELEDGQQHKSQRMSCSYLLCTILLFVAVLLAVTVTGIILLMNHYQAPAGPDGPPLISTNQDEANALVTIERGDGSRINIFIDPNCPDYNNNFLRLEGVQTSLLHSLTDHDTDLKSVKGQDRALLVKLAEEVAKLSAHASQLKMEYNALRQGQGNIGQELSTLQSEQGRLIQLLSESQINMVKVVNSVSDALSSMQKETGNIKTRLKADLQRAPVRTLRPKGCAGMKRIHALTIQANYELRIDLEDFENSTSFAHYGSFGVGLFSVDPDEDGYPLSVSDYSGTAGDSLLKHNGMKFTTKDKDNDHSENNCASFYHGAWWYRNCHTSNLNGQYLRGQHTSYADGIEWSSWTGWQYSLKFTEMKIRPTKEENK
ncbi:putative fibrinogen C domain-containing protein 1 [Triplophysa rosa]|uniref:Fibrinogen C domain-containing protein 1 n=1 Tax=Triplophysa rosa TaxID=992332 RepID=A0A9W7TL85_TRIRA|nr:putative fibrinogen C domain-containing protein 1 [Triplophysa rosa]